MTFCHAPCEYTKTTVSLDSFRAGPPKFKPWALIDSLNWIFGTTWFDHRHREVFKVRVGDFRNNTGGGGDERQRLEKAAKSAAASAAKETGEVLNGLIAQVTQTNGSDLGTITASADLTNGLNSSSNSSGLLTKNVSLKASEAGVSLKASEAGDDVEKATESLFQWILRHVNDLAVWFFGLDLSKYSVANGYIDCRFEPSLPSGGGINRDDHSHKNLTYYTCYSKWEYVPLPLSVEVVDTDDFETYAVLYSCRSLQGLVKYEFAYVLHREPVWTQTGIVDDRGPDREEEAEVDGSSADGNQNGTHGKKKWRANLTREMIIMGDLLGQKSAEADVMLVKQDAEKCPSLKEGLASRSSIERTVLAH